MTRADRAREGAYAVGTTGSTPGDQAFPGGRSLDRAVRALIAITIVSNVVYLGALLLPADPASVVVDIWLALIAQWVPAGVFWLVAVRTGFARWEVNLAAAGMTFNVAAETFYALAADSSGYLPSPSLADLGYLLYYPFTLAAIVLLVRRQSNRATTSVVFDSTLAVLGAAAVLAVILSPVFEDATTDVTAIEGAIAAMYPLFDILLIAVVVGISASPVLRMGPRWQFLVLGLLLFVGADIVYALLSHTGAYLAGTPLDAAWSAGVACSALWVNGVDRVGPGSHPTAVSARMLPVPAIAVLAGLGVLLLATQRHVPAVALILAAAAVALSAIPVMFRQATLTRLIEGQQQVVERLTQLDKSNSDIIGTVSHEMRTPLTSILGFLELALDDAGGPIPEDAKALLRVANRNARRLEGMVGNMLMMSRLESGAATPAPVPLEIGRLLGRAAESLRPFAESRKVGFEISCDDSVVVEADESQLERVFTNVMENAVKFTPAMGSVRIDVSSDITSANRSTVVISISDTGIGIPAEEIPHLFDRFFRATNARDGAVPGTGLGLAIVHEIVEAHHGELSVTSDLGAGTTFQITLPVTHAEAA